MLHKNINRFLAIAVGLMGFYILSSPYLPAFDYWLSKGKYPVPAYVEAAASASSGGDDVTNGGSNTAITTGNRLALPKIGVDAEIFEGPTTATLNKGLWHRPLTPTPLENGNTVIVGHRFTYNPSTQTPFYNLDKLAIGDPIVIAWNQSLVSYKVTEIKTVRPDQVEIEANTKEKQLTLYTCTPLWTNKYRLVVIAKPTGEIL